MNQNPIEDVLDFWKFLNYAKTCQETGNNKQLKSQLEEVVREIVSKS